MIRSRAAAFAVGAAVLLAGCSAGEPSAAPATASTGGGEPMHEDDHSAPPIPTTAPAGAQSPTEIAQDAMRIFADKTLIAEQWYELLAGFLSVEAQQAYYGTDPAEVPITVLAGDPALIEQTDYLATVDQATDVGVYRLLMSRAADGSWQVERITPPASS